MTWETRVQPASFRGVPFFLESHATEGGRNTDSQEQEVIYGKIPPATNDLGARRDVYVLEALVIGPEYDLRAGCPAGGIAGWRQGHAGSPVFRHLDGAGRRLDGGRKHRGRRAGTL